MSTITCAVPTEPRMAGCAFGRGDDREQGSVHLNLNIKPSVR